MKRGRLPQLRYTAVRGSRLASSSRSLAPCVCWPRPHCPLFGVGRSWLPLCPTGARHPRFGRLWTAPAACAKQRRLARAQGRFVPGFPTGPGLSPPVGSVVVVPPRACCLSLCPSGGRSFLVAAGRCPCRLLLRLSVLASGRYGRGVFGALPPRGQGFPLLDVGTKSPFGAAHPRPGHPRSCLSPAAEREWLSS